MGMVIQNIPYMYMYVIYSLIASEMRREGLHRFPIINADYFHLKCHLSSNLVGLLIHSIPTLNSQFDTPQFIMHVHLPHLLWNFVDIFFLVFFLSFQLISSTGSVLFLAFEFSKLNIF